MTNLGIAEKQISNQPKLKEEINCLDKSLEKEFVDKLEVCKDLSRILVSFQGNKSRPSYRWYKYKEGFSASLIDYFLNENNLNSGTILDPFAGSGTTLFVASERGLQADGIEILPICQQIIKKREILETRFTEQDVFDLQNFISEKVWEKTNDKISLNELRITRGAYPADTKNAIERFLSAIEKEKSKNVRNALEFALFCILETVSFTRKDGQYLRWDNSSGRRAGAGKPFSKGYIPDFSTAIKGKIKEIIEDLQANGLFKNENKRGKINLFEGSCLYIMPSLSADSYDGLITSPPYCNRYDYTRTYALELALLNVDEKGLVDLRQRMLSCTVENKAKNLLEIKPKWRKAVEVADSQELLQKILAYLEIEKAEKRLNNDGILRMVRGYFYEMVCVIAESARLLKQDAPLIMVNDNVRYAGVSISVDLILSDFAKNLGFEIEKILVLPKGKGNSSQQMGEHGREVLRKCVYIWRKI
ncbi:MAG: site-specific DNA-methyltransferase [Acidobacteriota bacterium]|nr:site-specific DNA-methyltransferase [Acidobacteriota bacterium]